MYQNGHASALRLNEGTRTRPVLFLYPVKPDKLPDMIDDHIFEGITGELRAALVAGYGALLEGLGDARIASFLFRNIMPDIYRSVFHFDTLHSIHDMVNSKDMREVTVYSSQETPVGVPLTVKFTRSSGRPNFNIRHGVIEIPIMQAISHPLYKAVKSGVRGNPYVLSRPMPYHVFVGQLNKAWNRAGYSYDSVGIKESIMRELTKWYSENRKPETIRTSAPDIVGDPSDYALSHAYRTARMDRGDAEKLAEDRKWATPEVMERYGEVFSTRKANALLGREEDEGLTGDDLEFLDDVKARAGKYNDASRLATNRELQSRISGLIPWLVRLQAAKGELPMRPTLDAMLNRVFDLPEDGPGIVREERDAAKARILPGAFRSAARRCAGLIDAANRMTYSYDMSIADRIECLASYMERNASEKQVSREL